LDVENISLSIGPLASSLTASDFIWCPVIEDFIYMKVASAILSMAISTLTE